MYVVTPLANGRVRCRCSPRQLKMRLDVFSCRAAARPIVCLRSEGKCRSATDSCRNNRHRPTVALARVATRMRSDYLRSDDVEQLTMQTSLHTPQTEPVDGAKRFNPSLNDVEYMHDTLRCVVTHSISSLRQRHRSATPAERAVERLLVTELAPPDVTEQPSYVALVDVAVSEVAAARRAFPELRSSRELLSRRGVVSDRSSFLVKWLLFNDRHLYTSSDEAWVASSFYRVCGASSSSQGHVFDLYETCSCADRVYRELSEDEWTDLGSALRLLLTRLNEKMTSCEERVRDAEWSVRDLYVFRFAITGVVDQNDAFVERLRRQELHLEEQVERWKRRQQEQSLRSSDDERAPRVVRAVGNIFEVAPHGDALVRWAFFDNMVFVERRAAEKAPDEDSSGYAFPVGKVRQVCKGVDRNRSVHDADVVARSTFERYYSKGGDDPGFRPATARLYTVEEQRVHAVKMRSALHAFVTPPHASGGSSGMLRDARQLALAVGCVDYQCELVVLSLYYACVAASPGCASKIKQKTHMTNPGTRSWSFFALTSPEARVAEQRTGVPAEHWQYGCNNRHGGHTWRANGKKTDPQGYPRHVMRLEHIDGDCKSGVGSVFSALDRYACMDGQEVNPTRVVLRRACEELRRCGLALRRALCCVRHLPKDTGRSTDGHRALWGLPPPSAGKLRVCVGRRVPSAPHQRRLGTDRRRRVHSVYRPLVAYFAAVDAFLALFDKREDGAVARALDALWTTHMEDVFTPSLRTVPGPSPAREMLEPSPFVDIPLGDGVCDYLEGGRVRPRWTNWRAHTRSLTTNRRRLGDVPSHAADSSLVTAQRNDLVTLPIAAPSTTTTCTTASTTLLVDDDDDEPIAYPVDGHSEMTRYLLLCKHLEDHVWHAWLVEFLGEHRLEAVVAYLRGLRPERAEGMRQLCESRTLSTLRVVRRERRFAITDHGFTAKGLYDSFFAQCAQDGVDEQLRVSRSCQPGPASPQTPTGSLSRLGRFEVRVRDRAQQQTKLCLPHDDEVRRQMKTRVCRAMDQYVSQCKKKSRLFVEDAYAVRCRPLLPRQLVPDDHHHSHHLVGGAREPQLRRPASAASAAPADSGRQWYGRVDASGDRPRRRSSEARGAPRARRTQRFAHEAEGAVVAASPGRLDEDGRQAPPSSEPRRVVSVARRQASKSDVSVHAHAVVLREGVQQRAPRGHGAGAAPST